MTPEGFALAFERAPEPRGEARDVRLQFWDPLPDVPFCVRYQLFDFAMEADAPVAIRALQRALGVPDDGVWGEQSQAAFTSYTVEQVVPLLIAQRAEWMSRNRSSVESLRRIAVVLRYAAEDIA